MKTARDPSAGNPPARSARRRSRQPPGAATLDADLTDSAEALRAVRRGEVDAVLLAGKDGNQVFSLEGADHAYRVLIESRNEGPLTLTAGQTILYANACFARMVKCPLEKLTGSSLPRLLSPADRAALRSQLKRPGAEGAKLQLQLHAADGSRLPVQLSIHPLAAERSTRATFGLVVTDMTEARRAEERLRALAHRVVQMQEVERERVAAELHDNITQLLCAVLFRSQALAEGISQQDGPARREVARLRVMLGRTANEVERISRNLRPARLEELGLVEVLRDASRVFAEHAGVEVRVNCPELAARLPAQTELALFRILQEAFKNVEKHARARRVFVTLKKQQSCVLLVIKDDGIGSDSDRCSSRRRNQPGLGVLGMRERAASVGGTFELSSAGRTGTEIKVRIPIRAPTAAK